MVARMVVVVIKMAGFIGTVSYNNRIHHSINYSNNKVNVQMFNNYIKYLPFCCFIFVCTEATMLVDAISFLSTMDIVKISNL